LLLLLLWVMKVAAVVLLTERVERVSGALVHAHDSAVGDGWRRIELIGTAMLLFESSF
jgi:hypothetical protein